MKQKVNSREATGAPKVLSRYGFIPVKGDDDLYRIKNADAESTRVIPEELSRLFSDEAEAILAIHKYFGDNR
jgi:hypothetical protein